MLKTEKMSCIPMKTVVGTSEPALYFASLPEFLDFILFGKPLSVANQKWWIFVGPSQSGSELFGYIGPPTGNRPTLERGLARFESRSARICRCEGLEGSPQQQIWPLPEAAGVAGPAVASRESRVASRWPRAKADGEVHDSDLRGTLAAQAEGAGLTVCSLAQSVEPTSVLPKTGACWTGR